MDILQEDILDIKTILFYYLTGASEVGLIDAELICCTERGGLSWPPLFCSFLRNEVQYNLTLNMALRTDTGEHYERSYC